MEGALEPLLAELSHAELGRDEALGAEVGRLVVSDRVTPMSRRPGVPPLDHRRLQPTPSWPRRRAGVLQLPEGGEQARPVGLDSAILAAEAELDGEPVAGGEPPHVLLRGPERGEPNGLREVGEVRVGEHGGMAEELMAEVGLGRVEGQRLVPHVLRAEEGAEGEAVEEVAGGEEAGDGANGEASPLLKEGRNLSLLRDALARQDALSLHVGDDVEVLPARVLARHGLQVVPHRPPGRRLLLRVLEERRQAAVLVLVRQVCNQLSALPVGDVLEARMVALELCSCVKRARCNGIELGDVEGKPGDLLLIEHEHVAAILLHLLYDRRDPLVPHVAIEVERDVEDGLSSHARTRLDPRQVDCFLLKGPQQAIERAGSILNLGQQGNPGSVDWRRSEGNMIPLVDL
eukprot:605831-Hanusia_phi.AAC.1